MPINVRDYALRLLAIRPRSVQEMRERLGRRGYGRPEVEATVADLADLGLLDDRKFAAQWVESRLAARPMGSLRLKAELLAKGVDREIVEATLSSYGAEVDEKAAALALAAKRIKALRGLKPDSARRRLAGFLSRRGFAAEVVATALRALSTDKKEKGR